MKSPTNKIDFGHLVSLGDLAKDLNINKSQLAYYAKIGILVPVTEYGKMRLYDHRQCLIALKHVKEAQDRGELTLTQMAIAQAAKVRSAKSK